MANLPSWVGGFVSLLGNERGAIFTEHIRLLTAQRDDAIRELEKSDKDRVSALAALADAKKEIAGLNSKIADLENKIRDQNPTSNLHPEALQILQYLFAYDMEFTAKEIADTYEMEIGLVKYHCDKLVELDFLKVRKRAITGRGDSPSGYVISSKGRTYLVENGLMPEVQ